MEYTFPSGEVHFSPIYVHEATPRHTGKRQIEVRFFHANYAEGVQENTYTLTVLHREAGVLAGQRLHASSGDETHALVVIRPLALDWLKLHFPKWSAALEQEKPLSPQLDRLLRGAP